MPAAPRLVLSTVYCRPLGDGWFDAEDGARDLVRQLALVVIGQDEELRVFVDGAGTGPDYWDRHGSFACARCDPTGVAALPCPRRASVGVFRAQVPRDLAAVRAPGASAVFVAGMARTFSPALPDPEAPPEAPACCALAYCRWLATDRTAA